jgi:hypothetical protein
LEVRLYATTPTAAAGPMLSYVRWRTAAGKSGT